MTFFKFISAFLVGICFLFHFIKAAELNEGYALRITSVLNGHILSIYEENPKIQQNITCWPTLMKNNNHQLFRPKKKNGGYLINPVNGDDAVSVAEFKVDSHVALWANTGELHHQWTFEQTPGALSNIYVIRNADTKKVLQNNGQGVTVTAVEYNPDSTKQRWSLRTM